MLKEFIMRLFDVLNKMSLFNKLVEARRTGPPSAFAKRLGVSRTTLYDMIDELNSYNVDVKYSRKLKTFYYNNSVSLDVSFKVKHLDNCCVELDYLEMKKVSGGKKIITSVLFSGRKDSIFVLQNR